MKGYPMFNLIVVVANVLVWSHNLVVAASYAVA